MGTGQSRQELEASIAPPAASLCSTSSYKQPQCGGWGQRSAKQPLLLSSEDRGSNRAEGAERGEEARHLRAGQGQTETFQSKGNKCFSGIQVV